MIGRAAIEQILAQYMKHGWKLRRVSLSPSLRNELANFGILFGDAEIADSQVDGLWFTRSSRPGITAWELRHLSVTPFALVENIVDGTDPAAAEEVLKHLETRMIETLMGRAFGH